MLPLRRTLAALWIGTGALACTEPTPPASTPDPAGSRPLPEGRSAAEAPPRSAESLITADLLRAHTEALSDDAMQGRRPGTDGGKRAVEYIVTAMRDLGLTAGGAESSFLQRVPMRAVEVDADAFALRFEAGRSRSVTLGWGTDFAGGSFASIEDRAVDGELVFVGYGATAPEYDWDDYADVDVRGKIVVAFVGDPPLTDGSFAGDALTYYGRWNYKFERALEAGAAGCLVVHETEPASYGWNVVQSSWSGERFGLDRPTAAPALGVQGWISADAATKLAKLSGSSLAQWHAKAIDKEFRAKPLGVRLRGTLPRTERKLADHNVLGMVRGATEPDRTVVIVGHWDHLGIDPDESKPDRIYNGAIDNASGIATILSVAAATKGREAAGQPLQQSVLFFASTAEEQGLLGSRYFVDHPSVDPAKITAVINLDSMNVQGETTTVEIVGTPQSTLEDLLAAVVEAQGRRVVPDTRPSSGGFYRSDQLSFARQGIVSLYFHAGLERREGGIAAGERIATERAARYHTVDDAFDPAWSFEGTQQDARAVFALVVALANGEFQPQWRPVSEFKDAKPPRGAQADANPAG